MNRKCFYCEKTFKSRSELSRHLLRCRMRLEKSRRKVSRREREKKFYSYRDASDFLSTQRELNENWKDDFDHLKISNIDESISNIRINVDQSDALQETISVSANEDIEDVTKTSISRRKEIMFTTSNEKTMIYEEIVKRSASDSISNSSRRKQNDIEQTKNLIDRRDRSLENLYWFFKSNTNYSFARWLHRSECIKEDVNNFFQNFKNESMWKNHLNFQSVDSWMNTIHRISDEIRDENWIKDALINESSYENVKSISLDFSFRDVVKILHFLINHRSFANNLAYASMREFNDDDKRVYNEMHTTNWWWNKQKNLSNNATIIFVLLTIDKTQLSQHHDDHSTWLVYLIIENLDKTTRRTQSKFSVILLDFLSHDRVKTESSQSKISKTKSRNYHDVMRIILKRLWSLFRQVTNRLIYCKILQR